MAYNFSYIGWRTMVLSFVYLFACLFFCILIISKISNRFFCFVLLLMMVNWENIYRILVFMGIYAEAVSRAHHPLPLLWGQLEIFPNLPCNFKRLDLGTWMGGFLSWHYSLLLDPQTCCFSDIGYLFVMNPLEHLDTLRNGGLGPKRPQGSQRTHWQGHERGRRLRPLWYCFHSQTE